VTDLVALEPEPWNLSPSASLVLLFGNPMVPDLGPTNPPAELRVALTNFARDPGPVPPKETLTVTVGDQDVSVAILCVDRAGKGMP
jgi:hypothetical protein